MKVLGEIVAQKRIDVAARMAQTPLAALHPQPTTRSLAKALRQPGARFILECKKASPSEGLIRADFNLDQIADAYRPFADAVSVLADEPFFQGSLNNVRRMRELMPQPILCKDFIVDPYQVSEARVYGADAVLLMLSVLDDDTYQRCAAVAQSLAMDVLTEVHDEEELSRALRLGAAIIGINNRNLKTMQVDLTTTPRLAALIPKSKVIVCESGIKSHADIEKLSGQVDGFLVGSSLMHEARLDLAVRRLIVGRVKICGLTNIDDALCAYNYGASWGGLIFAPQSPRCIDEATAHSIAQQVSGLPLVGVFVNEEVARIVELAHSLNLTAVQLHGEETRETIDKLRRSLPAGCAIWKAVRVKDSLPDFAEVGADRLLLDTYHATLRGGSGLVFDWSILDSYKDKDKCFIAGGLSPDNIVAAAQRGCYGLDVNSGVERAPGVKDHDAIQTLFARLRGEA